jgi:tRNA threonylcarbamoyl adenosine modification protein YjeE
MIEREIPTLSDTAEIVNLICDTIKNDSIILLRGELGVGKTTFVSHILKKFLDSSETFTSPTFTIVNHYYSDVRQCNIYHLDLYRIKDESELYEIGLNDMVDKGIVLIEWPEIAMNILKRRQVIMINLSFINEDIRHVTIDSTCKI